METVINTNITSLYPYDMKTGPSAGLPNKRKNIKMGPYVQELRVNIYRREKVQNNSILFVVERR